MRTALPERPDPDPEVSIVVPVFRTAATLETLQARLCHVLDGYGHPFEILYVDDACPEGSATILTRLTHDDQRTNALLLAHNIGQHQAALAGLAHARGEWIVVMDADLQDPPEAIPRLIDTGRQGYDAVFAGRRGSYESPARLATSVLFKRLLHWLCGVPADAGLFVAVRRTVVDRVRSVSMRRPSLVAMIGLAGARCASVPVTRAARPAGQSAYTFAMRLSAGLGVLAAAAVARLQPASTNAGTVGDTWAVRARLGSRWQPSSADTASGPGERKESVGDTRS